MQMADPVGYLNLNVAEYHSSYDGLRLLHANWKHVKKASLTSTYK